MDFRRYDKDRDEAAVLRIMREVGWIREGHEEDMPLFLQCGPAYVALLDGEPESCVAAVPGSLRYLAADLPFCCIGAVTTSRIARRQSLALRLTAEAVAIAATEGTLVTGLGIFDQGFYNRLGFGNGGYEPTSTFDPRLLSVDVSCRTPRRIGKDDWKAVHANRLAAPRRHGAVVLLPPLETRAAMTHSRNGFGLGYSDGRDGSLSHHVWFAAQDIGAGPYKVEWIAWHTAEQFLELMAVIKSLGDQVLAVRMLNPPGIQLQDLLDMPFYRSRIGAEGRFETDTHARAFWQMRILDLPACLEKTHLPGDDVRFNLRLSDPIDAFLSEEAPWNGIGGDYVVTLGPSSGADPGVDDALPTVEASVNALTRMWLGVLQPSGLALTDELSAPADLLEELDAILRLPQPRPNWDL